MPHAQPVDENGQQLDVAPVAQLTHSIAHERDNGGERLAEGIETARLDVVEPSLVDDERALPVVAAIEGDQDVAAFDIPERLPGITRSPRQAHPQDVDRRAKAVDRQPGP